MVHPPPQKSTIFFDPCNFLKTYQFGVAFLRTESRNFQKSPLQVDQVNFPKASATNLLIGMYNPP